MALSPFLIVLVGGDDGGAGIGWGWWAVERVGGAG